VRRREFISLLGGAATAWPLAASAQQHDRVRRIGLLMVLAESDPQSAVRVAALKQGLEKLGWTVGRNLLIDYRWGVSDVEQARTAASELLDLSSDVIVANAVSSARGAQLATRIVPIIFVGVSEPVAQGLVASLARPGGNTTGFTNFEPSISGKWAELLKQIAPIVRVAVIFNPASTSVATQFIRSIEAAAQGGLETIEFRVHEIAEIEPLLMKLGREAGVGLVFPPDSFIGLHHKLIIELAGRFRLPAVYPFRYFAVAGGLISYGPDVTDEFRRCADYVNRIFRGEAPGDLPVQQPTKFELAINLKTAKALGLDVPPTLLARADEVID
jgi:putative ABC transport system substrate-binding protein